MTKPKAIVLYMSPVQMALNDSANVTLWADVNGIVLENGKPLTFPKRAKNRVGTLCVLFLPSSRRGIRSGPYAPRSHKGKRG